MVLKGVYIMALFYNLLWALSICTLAYAQPGFISLDCGGEESYNDTHTIQWTSDQQYIQAGEKGIIPLSNLNQDVAHPLRRLRFFPYGKRNCYTLPAVMGNKYIIRSSFLYGDYDGLQSQPVFDLLIDANFWDSVEIEKSDDIIVKEIIVMARSTSISVCVARGGDDTYKNNTPFISSLELRPIKPSMYNFTGVGETYSLIYVRRRDFGSMSASSLRYPEDEFDRIWVQYADALLHANTTHAFEPDNLFAVPSAVMATALLSSGRSHEWTWNTSRSGFHLVVIRLAEVEMRPPNSTREIAITVNDDPSTSSTRTLKDYLDSTTYYLARYVLPAEYIKVSLDATNRSTMGPLVNAWEFYQYSAPLNNGTFAEDAAAIAEIARSLDLEKEWTGDPCLPQEYTWDWVVCSQDSSPRIIEVKLRGKELTGTIPLSFGKLSALVNLDLGINDLNGSIPEVLGQLPKLKKLDVSYNKLSGYVPDDLLDQQRNGQLVLSINGNDNICQPGACKDTSKRKAMVISLVIVGFVATVAIGAVMAFIKFKSSTGERKPKNLELLNIDQSRSFSYEEVRVMTHGFRKQIGKGGYGPVFHGVFQDKEVAVKILSENSHQGATEFSTEVDMLSKLHHKNLVKFIGYCIEEQNMILIYEYMSNGDLRHLLEDKISSPDAGKWERRLSIALDAAQGLEYLHLGCKPGIIHRDIKSSNILLNDRMEAKIADFGLSKMGPLDGATHVSTLAKGTIGYLDPEYYTTHQLTEKSDVFSFGVVLMEIISGRRPIFQDTSVGEEVHIVNWIREALLKGDIERIADPSLMKVYKSEAMWKVAEVAMACTSSHPMKRPAMSEVVLELKEAIRFQKGFYGERELSQMGSPAPLLHFSAGSSDKIELHPVAR